MYFVTVSVGAGTYAVVVFCGLGGAVTVLVGCGGGGNVTVGPGT